MSSAETRNTEPTVEVSRRYVVAYQHTKNAANYIDMKHLVCTQRK